MAASCLVTAVSPTLGTFLFEIYLRFNFLVVVLIKLKNN